MTQVNRIDQQLSTFRRTNKKALVAYLVAGDLPDHLTVEVIKLWDRLGVGVVEIGVPFSDPMADGPIISLAHTRSIQNNGQMHAASLSRILKQLIPMIREVSDIPIVLMSYFNPMIQYGDHFSLDAKAAGVDGVLAVDLPPEEAKDIVPSWQLNGLLNICLCSLTTKNERLSQILKHASGFLYCVSIKGVTGANQLNENELNSYFNQDLKHVDPELYVLIEYLKKNSNIPIIVGFGIKEPMRAKLICQSADGVVIGTAFVDLIEKWHTHKNNKLLLEQVQIFTQQIKTGLDQ